ncbi:tripeptidyl-peptidase [Aureococcus anophagefferens]|nr:tripeptidyl-peptidase [Aureococcus anophagefferens]
MLEAAKDLVEERVGLLSVMRAPATASQRAREESDAVEEKQQRATREGFALGRVVWFGCEGDYGRDFCFHVANGHTLVSLLRGHSMHPFERFDRACYLACVLCLNLFLSALVARDHAPATRKGKVAVVGALMAAHLDGAAHFFRTFLLMKALAWLFEFGPLAWGFYRRREAQRAYWARTGLERRVGGAYPFGAEWPTPDFLAERRVDPDPLAHAFRRRRRERGGAAKRQARADERRRDRAAADARAKAREKREGGVVAATREAAQSIELAEAGGRRARGDAPLGDLREDPLDALGRRA